MWCRLRIPGLRGCKKYQNLPRDSVNTSVPSVIDGAVTVPSPPLLGSDKVINFLAVVNLVTSDISYIWVSITKNSTNLQRLRLILIRLGNVIKKSREQAALQARALSLQMTLSFSQHTSSGPSR